MVKETLTMTPKDSGVQRIALKEKLAEVPGLELAGFI